MVEAAERLKAVAWEALEGLTGVVVPAVAEVLGGRPAQDVIDRVMRANRGWSAEQRAAAAEAVFGVGLWRRRLSASIQAPSGPEQAAVLLGALVRDLGGRPLDVAVRVSGAGELPPAIPLSSWADQHSVPDWLAELLTRELGEAEALAFARSINVPGPVFIRANSLRILRSELLEMLRAEGIAAQPCPYSRSGLSLTGRPNIYGSPAHQQGLFEVQDEGSQLIGLLLGARPGETVLDLCAGSGGKTLLLAAEMANQGILYAYDVDRAALERLSRRAQRAGVRNLRILYQLPPESLQADRVLVDAPCSSLGTLRRGPDVRFRMDPSTFVQWPPLQRQLLRTALTHLSPHGSLLYATCTVRREENADMVGAFLSEHPELGLVPPRPVPQGASAFWDGGLFRSLPHRHGTDGFFGALMRQGAV